MTLSEFKELEKIGSQSPTKAFYDSSLSSFMDLPKLGEDLRNFGMRLYPWQDLILRNSLAVYDGRLYYANVGMSVPRQNGKSEILVWRAFIGILYLNQQILYTSYNKDSARAIYKRMQTIIDRSEFLSRYVKYGDQHNNMWVTAYNPRTGGELGTIEFHTRAGGKARGESYDVIFFDEAQFLTSGQVASATPTTATFSNAQIWYVGTPPPVDAAASRGATASEVAGTVFRRVRREILFKGKGHSCFFEWGVESVVSKSDKKFWYQANPSLGFVTEEGRGLTEKSFIADPLSEEEFLVERLGFWSEQERGAVIDSGTWRELEVDKTLEKKFTSPSSHDSVTLAIKSDYEEEWINVALVFRKNDEYFVRVADSFSMSEPWVEKVMVLIDKMLPYNKCKEIIIDGEAAQHQIIQALRKRGKWPRSGYYKRFGKVVIVTPNQARLAPSNFVSKIVDKIVYHGGQPQVDAAIFDAEKRMKGKAWWGFRSISGKTRSGLLEVLALGVYRASEEDVSVVDVEKEAVSGFVAPEWRSV